MISKIFILSFLIYSCSIGKPIVNPNIPIITVDKKRNVTVNYLNWSAKNELFIKNYQVQRSPNGRNRWVTILPMFTPLNFKDSSQYHFTLPNTSLYYRIAAQSTLNKYYYTSIIYSRKQ